MRKNDEFWAIFSHYSLFLGLKALKDSKNKMRDQFLATLELNVCAKFQVHSLKTVAATLRTYIHCTYRQKGETGETWGKPKYVAELRPGLYTVQIREIVQFSD